MLSHNAGHHDGERQLEPRYRMHCVLRLFRYFQPLEQHLDIEERFSLCIRQGYLHRSPLSPNYAMALADGYNAIKSGRYILPVTYNPTGSGFTIIGLSGVGKTSAVTRILSLYPQVIIHSRYHDIPLVLKQIVWLKLDCPHDALVKGLCMEFFEAIDRTAGTNYFELYANLLGLLKMRSGRRVFPNAISRRVSIQYFVQILRPYRVYELEASS